MITDPYQALIERKLALKAPVGLSAEISIDSLFPHQRALTQWALRRGRCAIFADTGLGKTRMELAWGDAVCRETATDCLILAPLSVAAQTVEEGAAIGIPVTLCRQQSDVRPGINIANYERLHRFDPSHFGSIVLDESSCIKHAASKTLAQLMEAFSDTPYRLCATATPAPNDWTEFGTHAEFLGVCKQTEMLSEFFVHDGGETQVWRLKRHATEAFWRWVASWGALVRSPADLGFDATAYQLPPLEVTDHIVPSVPLPGQLFPSQAQTLSERRSARKDSLALRVRKCVDIVNGSSEPWIVWCDLNAEGDALTQMIDGAKQVKGADDIDTKEELLTDFRAGAYRVLVSKSSICGWGLNWQHCARMAFVGVTDSFESYYQSVRRCYRFGQRRPVQVHIFASEAEGAVVANLKRKELDAVEMASALSRYTLHSVRDSVLGVARHTNIYQPVRQMTIPSWFKGVAC